MMNATCIVYVVVATVLSIQPLLICIAFHGDIETFTSPKWVWSCSVLIIALQLQNWWMWESQHNNEVVSSYLHRIPTVLTLLMALAFSIFDNIPQFGSLHDHGFVQSIHVSLQSILVAYLICVERRQLHVQTMVMAISLFISHILKSLKVGLIQTLGVIMCFASLVGLWTPWVKQLHDMNSMLGQTTNEAMKDIVVQFGWQIRAILLIVAISDTLVLRTSSTSTMIEATLMIDIFQIVATLTCLNYHLRCLYRKSKIDAKLQTNYVRYISHEIRSPLSTIILGIDLVVQSLRDLNVPVTTKAVEMLQDVSMSCDLAVNNINNLLDFEKLKDSVCEIHNQIVFVDSYMQRCLRPLMIQAKSLNINLELTLPSDTTNTFCINVDMYRFEQVVRNLISNALKFAQPDSTVHVNCVILPSFSGTKPFISIFPNATCVFRIEVIDQGPGLTKEQISSLFGEFVQFNADELQNGKGSGLGLWLSKLIVDIHGGIVSATSAGEGLGSTFYVEIPCLAIQTSHEHCNRSVTPAQPDIENNINEDAIKDDRVISRLATIKSTSSIDTNVKNASSEESIEIDKNSRSSSNTNKHDRKYSILICDDSVLSRKMLARLLQPFCSHCDLACDGEEAIALVQQSGGYDVVVMDLYMPRLCGTQAVQAIRGNGYRGFVIGLTGASSDEITSFLHSGADIVMTKPFDPKELMRAIHNFEEKRSLAESSSSSSSSSSSAGDT